MLWKREMCPRSSAARAAEDAGAETTTLRPPGKSTRNSTPPSLREGGRLMQVGSKNLSTGDDVSSGWTGHERQRVAGESNQPKAEAQGKENPTKPAQQEDKTK